MVLIISSFSEFSSNIYLIFIYIIYIIYIYIYCICNLEQGVPVHLPVQIGPRQNETRTTGDSQWARMVPSIYLQNNGASSLIADPTKALFLPVDTYEADSFVA